MRLPLQDLDSSVALHFSYNLSLPACWALWPKLAKQQRDKMLGTQQALATLQQIKSFQ